MHCFLYKAFYISLVLYPSNHVFICKLFVLFFCCSSLAMHLVLLISYLSSYSLHLIIRIFFYSSSSNHFIVQSCISFYTPHTRLIILYIQLYPSYYLHLIICILCIWLGCWSCVGGLYLIGLKIKEKWCL